jgi:hypothetical protein
MEFNAAIYSQPKLLAAGWRDPEDSLDLTIT